MEFGIFIQAHLPRSRWDNDPDAEHTALLREAELVEAADRNGWKYVWVTEHHFLSEYSHLSANEVYLGYLAHATDRIHIGSGIFNINPQVNHPARVAERVAMLDHLSNGRFEFGTGRGAGSREVTGFGLPDTNVTKEIYDAVIPEFVKMWRDGPYSHDGKWFSMPPREILPKPWRNSHPALWVAAGNPPTYEKAARRGMGVLGFNVASINEMEPMVRAYKNAIGSAEPVGEYVNDNVMITNGLVCLEDGRKARNLVCRMGIGYLQSLVFHYHDTFPPAEGLPGWPDLIPEPTPEDVEYRINEGFILCGDPDEVVAQAQRYESVGADQLVFGLPLDLPFDAALESIELFGQHVIPKLDPDPVHRTTRFRQAAPATTRTPRTAV
jgi:alkanesulfonate monooxygenase SsuD/methylene tetrahydromethanopterin reductase-like flavin-dependent oxidoreductase (luciferase family)